MKRGSTIFLRVTVIVMGLIALALSVLLLPAIHAEWGRQYPDIAYMKYPTLIGLGGAAIPFFIALYQAWKLLDYIDKNTAFSELSVTALKYIKYCALIISGLFTLGLPLVYYVADREDAPGIMVIGLFFVFASVVIAGFAAVLQMLLQNAIDIKSENDLTV